MPIALDTLLDRYTGIRGNDISDRWRWNTGLRARDLFSCRGDDSAPGDTSVVDEDKATKSGNMLVQVKGDGLLGFNNDFGDIVTGKLFPTIQRFQSRRIQQSLDKSNPCPHLLCGKLQ